MSFRHPSPLIWIISIIFLLAITLPYGYAAISAGERDIFGGFLLNPIDGNTYLAKMYQGWEGSWKYTLPYTPQVSQGAYINLYYLVLGHLARWINLPLIWVFHAARVLGAIFLLWALYRFLKAFSSGPRQLGLAFGVAALGSGMGWMLLPFGVFTADFWVAEAYPFLSAYVNPHFPLSLGLLLWLLTPIALPAGQAVLKGGWKNAVREWRAFFLALGIALLSPFAVVIALLLLGLMTFLALVSRKDSWRCAQYAGRFFWAALGGAPVLIYDLVAILGDTQLRAWNTQNLTPAPPIWDLFFSFSPALILAILGSVTLWRSRRFSVLPGSPDWRLPLIWGALALVLLYLPLSLQRRFLLGWYVPLVALAIPGLEWLSAGNARRFRLLAAMLLILALPTNLLILATARQAVQTHNAELFLRREEKQAFDWLAKQPSRQAVVLASPRTGLFIPAYTGMRVVYGHPFETAHAEQQKQATLDFYQGAMDRAAVQDLLQRNRVEYIFYGPAEQALGQPAYLDGLQPVFRSVEVQIFFAPDVYDALSSKQSQGQVR